jgi:hypothetical protein
VVAVNKVKIGSKITFSGWTVLMFDACSGGDALKLGVIPM